MVISDTEDVRDTFLNSSMRTSMLMGAVSPVRFPSVVVKYIVYDPGVIPAAVPVAVIPW